MTSTEKTIEVLIGQLREVGKKTPDVVCYPVREPDFGNGINSADIAALEAMFLVPFPPDYRAFLKSCGSIVAMDVWNGYHLFDVAHITDTWQDTLLPKTTKSKNGRPLICVGGDGGGNLFLMSLGIDNIVWKWNHEEFSHEDSTAEALAGNFTEFLQRMLVDWQQFIAGNGEHRYMSG